MLLSSLVANGCCGKQCSQGQIRAEGSSFLLQTHAHRLQVSTLVRRRAQDHQWWCAECRHLACLLSNVAGQTFTVPCLLQHKGVFKMSSRMDLVQHRPLHCVDFIFGMVLEYFASLCKTTLRYNIVRNYNACDHCSWRVFGGGTTEWLDNIGIFPCHLWNYIACVLLNTGYKVIFRRSINQNISSSLCWVSQGKQMDLANLPLLYNSAVTLRSVCFGKFIRGWSITSSSLFNVVM